MADVCTHGHENVGFIVVEERLASQEKLCSKEFVNFLVDQSLSQPASYI